MMWRFACVLLLLLSINVLKAQKKSDFEVMITHSLEKLYQDPDLGIKSCKNISLTETQQHEKLIVKSICAEAYAMKANFSEAVKLSLENTNANNSWKKEDLFLINLGVIQQFQNLGFYEQSKKLINQLIKDTANWQSYKSSPIIFAKLYQLQAKNLSKLKQYDSALFSLKKSARYCHSKVWETSVIIIENKLSEGYIYKQKKEIDKARKAFNQALLWSSQNKNNYLYAVSQELLARLLFEEQDYQSAIDILTEALNKVEDKDYMVLKTKIYASLSNSYLALGDVKNYQLFLKKYQDNDKKIEEDRKEATRNLLQLNQENQNQNYKNFVQKNQLDTVIISSIFIAILSIFFIYYYQQNQKRQLLNKQIVFFRNQEKLLTDKNSDVQQKESIAEIAPQKKQLIIPKEKEKELLQKLQNFEESRLFLDRNMSLAVLAGQLETNTKYLSEVINKYKEKSFTAYINELKINHIAYLLSTDPSYKQYKISYLAEVAGFTSHSTFTIVFKSVTGMSPNDYIQQLRKRKII